MEESEEWGTTCANIGIGARGHHDQAFQVNLSKHYHNCIKVRNCIAIAVV
jgi:hypothetical protein